MIVRNFFKAALSAAVYRSLLLFKGIEYTITERVKSVTIAKKMGEFIFAVQEEMIVEY
jgi:hypothetical protein